MPEKQNIENNQSWLVNEPQNSSELKDLLILKSEKE